MRGTRVTLDMIVTAFRAGATAEEVAQKFPTRDPQRTSTRSLPITESTTDIDAYLSQRKATAAALKFEIEKRSELRYQLMVDSLGGGTRHATRKR